MPWSPRLAYGKLPPRPLCGPGANKVVEGDLVLDRSVASAARVGSRNKRQRQQQGQRLAGSGAADKGEEGADEEEDPGSLPAVHVATAEEAAAGTWSVEDVVLPLPGCAVAYPSHDTGRIYRELAAKDGVPLDGLAMHGAREFSMAAVRVGGDGCSSAGPHDTAPVAVCQYKWCPCQHL